MSRGSISGTSLASPAREGIAMSLVRLLGFKTLTCGCVSGRYWEISASREVRYIEEKGSSCADPAHQRNQPVSPDRVARGFNVSQAS